MTLQFHSINFDKFMQLPTTITLNMSTTGKVLSWEPHSVEPKFLTLSVMFSLIRSLHFPGSHVMEPCNMQFLEHPVFMV